MLFLLANTVFLVLSLGYGWLAGGRSDKLAVLWIAMALGATFAASTRLQPLWVMPTVLLIDIILLVAIGWIALRSTRYWPTWFAGLHLAGVVVALAAWATVSPADGTLRLLAGFWGIPALLAMVLGLYLDRRGEARLRGQAQPST